MKAKVQYGDFSGTVSADIADHLGGPGGDDMRRLGKQFNLNEDRFTLVGVSLYGTDGCSVSLLCVDKERSTTRKEHIVSMSVEVEKQEILDLMFKRLKIVLHDRYDEKYPKLDYDEETRYSDFHEDESGE